MRVNSAGSEGALDVHEHEREPMMAALVRTHAIDLSAAEFTVIRPRLLCNTPDF